MSLSDSQRDENKISERCMNATSTIWVPHVHDQCWDPEECDMGNWEEVSSSNCPMKAVSAKLDKCDCGKVYHYP